MLPWLLIITPAVYPHLIDFTGKPSLEHSRGFPEFPNQNLRQICQGVPGYNRTNKQLDRQTEITTKR